MQPELQEMVSAIALEVGDGAAPKLLTSVSACRFITRVAMDSF
jgi:hypothetical protein